MKALLIGMTIATLFFIAGASVKPDASAGFFFISIVIAALSIKFANE